MNTKCELRWTELGEVRRVVLREAISLLGRDHDCTLLLRDTTVSRHHALIRRVGSTWHIEDKSHNGLKVNGEKIRAEELRDGDELSLGSQTLYVCITSSDESRTTILARPPSEPRPKLDSSQFHTVHVPNFRKKLSTTVSCELFFEVNEVIQSARDLTEMLDGVLGLLFESLPADRGIVALTEPGGGLVQRLSRTRVKQSSSAEVLLPPSTIMEIAIDERRAVLIPDALRTLPTDSVIDQGVNTALCAPLITDEDVHGIIYLDTTGQVELRPKHLERLAAVAVLSSAGIRQMRLRDEMDRQRRAFDRFSSYLPPTFIDLVERGVIVLSDEMELREAEVSVLFADLVGSTELFERLGPVEAGRLINRVFDRLSEEIWREDGTLDKYVGDELVAFFGAPVPQSDHADRAVRAGIALQAAIGEVSTGNSSDPPLSLRIGIQSGAVVVGDIGSVRYRDYTVVGDTVNTAKRLQVQCASSGELVIGGATRERLRDRFDFSELGHIELRGREESCEAFVVLGRLTEGGAG